MRKYRLPLSWIAAVALSLGFIQGAFSQSSGSTFELEQISYRSMGEEHVAHVFEDHLPQSFRSQSRDLARHLLRLSRRYDFHPAFVLALIQIESSFNPLAHSRAGAIGLMQLMPPTAKSLARKLNYERAARLSRRDLSRALTDPFISLSLGVAYLHELRTRYPEASPYYMLAAYNLGPGRLRELLVNPKYRPSLTLERYIQGIRSGVEGFRTYRRKESRV